ncbi:hypothetical protein [Nocardioides sp. GXZ039]|uniref:hypothetical protein n=1 Tax=Nocardioides sp. GXZ039 TaxID=3136018 RepID=UPI0030F3D08E
MGEYLLHLALVLAWVPLSLAIRFAGLKLGFAIARRYGDSSRGATAVAAGEAVNTGSFILAAALPLLGLPTALVVGIMRLADSEQASGLGLLSGVAISLPLAVLFLFVGVFTFDQTPRDAAPRLAEDAIVPSKPPGTARQAPASRTLPDVVSSAEPGTTPTRLAWVSRSQVHNIEGWVVYAAILIDDDQVDHLRAEARRMVDESRTSAARNLGFELTFDLLGLVKRSTATGLVAYARLSADSTPETTRRADLTVQRAVH